jgi:hypothetical protein
MQSGRPISFFRKSIGPKVVTMSTYEKEALAIIEALKSRNIILMHLLWLLEQINRV